MSYLSAIILGIVQGVAEFLPISSSGHLAIFQTFFGLTDVESENLFFDVLLHLGTLAAVFVAYRKEIGELILAFFSLFTRDQQQAQKAGHDYRPARRLILLIIVATLPLFLILPIKDSIESLYTNTFFVGGALIFTGLLLFASDRFPKGYKTEKSATMLDAVLVGCAQALATVPGLSRSGTTISAGLVRRFDRSFAVRFSFLMSIPAVLGANILSLIDAAQAGVNWSLLPVYLVGVAVAGVTGYLSIRLLKFIASRGSFGGFAYYCWGAGAFTIIMSLVS